MMGRLAAILNAPIKTVTLDPLIANGSFAVTTGWTSTGASFSVASNIASFVANSAVDTLYKEIPFGDTCIFYGCGWVKATSGADVALGVTDGSDATISAPYKGAGEWQFLSFIYNAALDGLAYYFCPIIDNRSSAWDTVNAKYVSLINLTDDFGAGNEPNKETMDFIMTQFSNYFLAGTISASYY